MKTSGSLAVKYRPRHLEDIVGHESEVKRLMGILKDKKKFPSVLFFTGDTGVGKTTLARMFAQYVNCDTNDACGKCENCKYGENHPDYKELNVADSRGIDDIRAIAMSIKNRPRIGKFRIYMLDECHALTSQAASALLVPLENPPPHSLWILATSEPTKVLGTIVGRSIQFHLKRPTKQEVSLRLKKISKKEGFDWASKKLRLEIGNLSGGHVRNAISTLESCSYLVSGNPKTTEKDLIKFVKNDAVNSFERDEQKIVIHALLSLYIGNNKELIKAMLNLKDNNHIPILNSMIWINQYMIESQIESKHPNVWHTKNNIQFKAIMKDKIPEFDPLKSMRRLLSLQDSLVTLRMELQQFTVAERPLIVSRLTNWIIKNK